MAKRNTKSNAKRAAKAAKKNPTLFIAAVIILVIIIAAVAALWYFKPDVFDSLLGADGKGGNNNPEAPLTGAQGEIAESDFSIHFLDVGNKFTGDCILIDCGDTEVLIDAGSRQSSATTIKQYIDNYCTDGKLEYVIATHAHQDHIAAFVGNVSGNTRTGILYQYNIGTLINFDLTDATTQIYNNYMAAVAQAEEKGTAVYTASQCYYQLNGASSQYYLDEAKTLSINVLYNYYYDHPASNENDYSVVILLRKELPDGNKHFLFTGDLEESGEKKLAEYYSNPSNSQSEFDFLPKVELFKAGHHGSYTASTNELLKIISPAYVAVCCCTGSDEYATNPDHYFPAQEFIDRISKYTDKIYCTNIVSDDGASYSQMNGNIVFYADDGALKLWCSNNTTILKETDWFKQYRIWNN